MKTNITFIGSVLILSAFFVLPFDTLAQSVGSLDLSFDTDGIVTTPIGSLYSKGYSLALQIDGKIVVAGYSNDGANRDFAVVRYNTNGSLDTTFDTDGKVTTAIGVSSEGRSVAIQMDGKIVVAGFSYNGSNFDFALVRYNTNGSLDTTFDSDGKVTTAIGTADDVGYSVAIQSDGKIVVAGFSDNSTNDDFALVRYNTNGGLDNTLDSDGKVTTAIGFSDDIGCAIAIQSDGKIAVSGVSNNGTNKDIGVVRYNANGSLDSTFGVNGIVTTPIGIGDNGGLSMAIQSDGKILVAGWSFVVGTNNDIALVRYNTNGSLDATFDSDGIVSTPIGTGHDLGYSVAIQSDGKIVVAVGSYNGSNYDLALIRCNTNGSLDTTFDTDGKVNTAIGISAEGYAIAIQTDGKIVVGGWSDNGSGVTFALARYNNAIVEGINTSDNQTNVLKIYPNPFSTRTTLNSSAILNDATLTVYSIYGHLLKQVCNLSGLTINFQRNNLPSGMYIIKLTEANKVISTNKLVILD